VQREHLAVGVCVAPLLCRHLQLDAVDANHSIAPHDGAKFTNGHRLTAKECSESKTTPFTKKMRGLFAFVIAAALVLPAIASPGDVAIAWEEEQFKEHGQCALLGFRFMRCDVVPFCRP
jgi:hypothetical protein